MGDYYISNANFKVKSRLTVSPVCLTIDYNKKISGANLSSQFFVTQSESIVLAGLNPLVMESNLVFETILYKKPKWQALIDYACLGVHWKPNHTYRVVLGQDFLREKAAGTEPFLTSSMSEQELTFTTNPLPVLTSTSPLDNAATVTNNTTIQFVFDRLMRPGTGNVYLYKVASPSNILLGTYNVNMDVEQTNSQYDITTFSIDTLGVIEANQSYYILTDAKVFRDFDEFYYPQITSNTTYNFTTAPSTNNQFPDLISFVMSSGTITSTYIRYRNPGPTIIDASANLVGPNTWRIRRSPSSLTSETNQTVSLKYANATSRPNLTSEFEFVDIFLTYANAGGRATIDASANLVGLGGIRKAFQSGIIANATVLSTPFRTRPFVSAISSAFDETANVEYGVLQTTRGNDTYSTNTSTTINNGPQFHNKILRTRIGDGLGYHVMTATMSDAAAGTLSLTNPDYERYAFPVNSWTSGTSEYLDTSFTDWKTDISDNGNAYAFIGSLSSNPVQVLRRDPTVGNWTTVFSANWNGEPNIGANRQNIKISGDGERFIYTEFFNYYFSYLTPGGSGSSANWSFYYGKTYIYKYYSAGNYYSLEETFQSSTVFPADNTISVPSGTDPNTVLPANDFTGQDVCINYAGDTIALADGEYGKVYIYTRSGTTWTLQTTLTGLTTDYDGYKMDFSNNGNTLAVSVLNSGATSYLYIYTRSGTTWTLQTTFNDTTLPGFNNMDKVRLSSDGLTLAVVNRYGPNTIKVLFYNGTSWTTQDSFVLDYAGLDEAVNGLSLTNNGNTLTYSWGFEGNGYTVIKKRSGSTWTTFKTIESGAITTTTGSRGDISSNMSEDDSTLLILDSGQYTTGLSTNVVLYAYCATYVSWNNTTKTLTWSGSRAFCRTYTDLITYTPTTGYTGSFTLTYTGTIPLDGRSTTRTQAITRV